MADYGANWKQPAVWNDLHQIYKGVPATQPDSVAVRSAYANAAFQAEQWKLADELFTALGDKADLIAMDSSPKRYEYMRSVAAEHTRQE